METMDVKTELSLVEVINTTITVLEVLLVLVALHGHPLYIRPRVRRLVPAFYVGLRWILDLRIPPPRDYIYLRVEECGILFFIICLYSCMTQTETHRGHEGSSVNWDRVYSISLLK